MSEIKVLPKNLANQIAAGEVVERPVSVVKELVENSLDAGASQIGVEIVRGGIEEIVVTDNGSGISSHSLELLGTKHATSKISSLEDLYTVLTFGFRGEALASISSVGDFEMYSRKKEDASGKKIHILFGDKQKTSDIGMEVGTKVSVKNIFGNTPARLNYLKSANTEKAHIEDFLKNISLAYPEVSFSFFVDGKKNFLFPSEEDETQRIFQVFGKDFYDHILPISFSLNGVSITGYITNPKIHFQNKERQVLFINKRMVRSFSLFKAISDAYNRYIPHGTYPGYVLHLGIDPTEVDVNVHPRKLEVRFAREQEVFRALYHALEKSLESSSLVGENSAIIQAQSYVPPSFPEQKKYYVGSGTKFQSYSPYKDVSPLPNQSQISDAISFSQEFLQPSKNAFSEDTQSTYGKIVGQVFNSYIIVEGKETLIVFDQHALAERVIYERLCTNTVSTSQKLLVGETLHLTPKEFGVFQNCRKTFEEMGFECEEISGNTLIVNAIPDFVKKEKLQTLLQGILHDIGEQSFTHSSKTLEEVKNKIRAFTACRSAVKFGDILTMFEMKQLLQDASIAYSSTCPHGRPVVFEVHLDDLKGRFDR